MLATMKLLNALQLAELPVMGVSNATPLRIDFQPDATNEQKAAAEAIRDGATWEDDAPPAEYQKKRKALQAEYPVEVQVEAVYKFAKNLREYIGNGGIQPDINAKPGTPEHWIAWQDQIREKVPKPGGESAESGGALKG